MKYLTNFENYEYQLNEGFVDNLKKMASIGLLTTSMLMGNSSVAQQYKTLDPKQKTEIKDEVKANKVFRIGDIKMGMTTEELKSLSNTGNLDGYEVSISLGTEKLVPVEIETMFDIEEKGLRYLINNKDYRLMIVEEYHVNNTILLKNITLMFYKNHLFLIYSDILYNQNINIDPIDLDGYDVKTETDTYRGRRIGTFFFDPKVVDCFYEDISDMKKSLRKEENNNKKTNSKDLFGE